MRRFTAILSLVGLLLASGDAAGQQLSCASFRTQEDAQAVLEANPDDRFNLDPDGNGMACEEKPARSGTTSRAPARTATATPTPRASLPAPTTSTFPDPLDADVDLFWGRAFAAAGLTYDPPAAIVGFEATVATACGGASPRTAAAFYCPLDRTIYYSGEFRRVVMAEVGDFAWITVVAHEWGHHVQQSLGISASDRPQSDAERYSIVLELQADCLAGVYAADADARGWLDPGDIEEALALTAVVGDPGGTHWADVEAHGTGDQRLRSFERGYAEGLAGCDLAL